MERMYVQMGEGGFFRPGESEKRVIIACSSEVSQSEVLQDKARDLGAGDWDWDWD